MKKIINFSVPLKAFAAMILAGFVILYMVSGTIYAMSTGEAFEYSIPFVFIIQGAVMASLISVLWGIFLSDAIIKEWRFFKRFIAFKMSLVPLLALCFFTFLAIPADWTIPWFITVVGISIGVVALAIVSEAYFRKTGKKYTEALSLYKKNL